MSQEYDALVVVSFGGPERREDVMPFLDNVLRGRNVPLERRLEVAEHYFRFEGRSPIGPATRAMTAAIAAELGRSGPPLRVYQGNRNWHPFLADTVRRMAEDGVRRALALVTSAFGSYSGCRQYLEDIERARAAVGAGAPAIEKLRLFWDHPDFTALWADRVRGAHAAGAHLLFTAHSIPLAMAAHSPYREQLEAACAAIATACGGSEYGLAFQSRSGPPQQAWLEPSVEEALDRLAGAGVGRVVAVPLGFLSDHMEVVYDLDVEACAHAQALGLEWRRVATIGDHPGFAGLVRQLVLERSRGTAAGEGRHCCGETCCRLASH